MPDTLCWSDSVAEECTKSLYAVLHPQYIRISRYCRHLVSPTPIWIVRIQDDIQLHIGRHIGAYPTTPNSEMNSCWPYDIYVIPLRLTAGLAGSLRLGHC